MLLSSSRTEQYLEDDDHVKVAQVEANPFQVDNGNSRHGHHSGRGLHQLDQAVDSGHDEGCGLVGHSMEAQFSEGNLKL